MKAKYHSDGWVGRHKCRLINKGHSQMYDADYDQTFSLVILLSLIRMLLSFAAQNNLYVHQIDGVTEFLNRHLEEEIIEQPEEHMKLEEGFHRVYEGHL